MESTYVIKIGSALPDDRVSNLECVSLFPRSSWPEGLTKQNANEWIYERTGIRERAYLSRLNVGDFRNTNDEELQLTLKAIEGWDLASIDSIITVRSNPNNSTPSLSQKIVKHYGLRYCFTLDLHQPSTGLISALTIAASLPYQNTLIIAAETLSPFLNLEDLGTSILFGDGVGALWVSKDLHFRDNAMFEVEDQVFYSKPDTSEVLKFDHASSGFQMKGPELFRKAIPEFKRSAQALLNRHEFSFAEIDWYLPHQANSRMILKAAEMMGFSEKQMITNLERVGNTSSASMIIALHEVIASAGPLSEPMRPNERVLLNACGAGLSAGASLWRVIRL